MMKNIILLSLLLGFTFVSFACKREWTCQCVKKNGNVTQDVQHVIIKDATMKDAKSECKGMEEKTDDYTVECSL